MKELGNLQNPNRYGLRVQPFFETYEAGDRYYVSHMSQWFKSQLACIFPACTGSSYSEAFDCISRLDMSATT